MMPDPSADNRFLRRALDLAREGLGLASPNPCVGAVIVDAQGSIAGTGAYTFGRVKHAEILALEEAGGAARGGTLYINLEPHAHQGRTPPCTEALIAAGIARVVASMPDPNPRVSGRGFEQLRAAGIDVLVGGLQEEARQLNEAFAKYIRTGIPLATLKVAMTLDAKIGVRIPSGSGPGNKVPAGGWITSEAARAHVQEQRHQSDAVLTGIGTVLADDPLLTDRSGKPRRRPLLRVILDSKLRIPLQSRLLQDPEQPAEQSVLVFCSVGDEGKKAELERRGVRVFQFPSSGESHIDSRPVLRRLGELEIASVLIECGATLGAAILASGAVDKLFLYYAPKIMGEIAGAISFARACAPPGRNRVLATNVHLHRFEEDVAIEGYLRDPYE